MRPGTQSVAVGGSLLGVQVGLSVCGRFRVFSGFVRFAGGWGLRGCQVVFVLALPPLAPVPNPPPPRSVLFASRRALPPRFQGFRGGLGFRRLRGLCAQGSGFVQGVALEVGRRFSVGCEV